MTRKELLDYIVELDEVMERTARRSDIWQDRAVYAMAKALRGLVLDRLHEMNKELLEGKRGGLDG